MVSSGELSILMKVSELAERLGLRSSDTDATIAFVDEDSDPVGNGFYRLSFAGWPTDPEKSAKFEKFASLLGIEQDQVTAEWLDGLEARVDDALALAPRSRLR